MLVRYEFVTGTVEIEVDGAWGEVLVDMDRRERNNNQTETRRHASMEMMQAQGIPFPDEHPDGTDVMFDREQFEFMVRFLMPQQRALLRRHLLDGESVASIARAEGVTEGAIRHRLMKAISTLKKTLKKFL